LNFFTCELKNIFFKIEVKRKKWQDFKILDNGLLITLPVPSSKSDYIQKRISRNIGQL
jgi:hypothetical protein